MRYSEIRGLPQNVIDAFVELGKNQRDLPERAMIKVQFANGGGVLNGVVEHVGDLTHRMSHAANRNYDGYIEVFDKVRKTLRWLSNGYGFEREHFQNIKSNAEYQEINPEDLKKKIDEALLIYGKEHSKLVVYNEAQYFARQAAVNLGYQKWDVSVNCLDKLKEMLVSPEIWRQHAFHYELDNDGNIIPYQE